MRTFRYKAISKGGEKVSGVIESYDEFEAVSRLRDTCNIITSISEVKESKAATQSLDAGRIADKELALICSQFSIIISSGLPLVRCVEMVASQQRNKDVRRMLEKVAYDIASGYGLAQSFEANCPKLQTTFIETVRAGEQSGTLENCFKRLYAYYDKRSKTKGKVTSALIYPAIVVFVAIVVFIIIMVVAVPLFTKTFEEMGVELPFITRALIGVSKFITGYWWVLLLIVAICVVGWLLAKRSERGRRAISAFTLTRAPLSKIKMMNLCAQFASTMSTMISAGLPIVRAIEITSDVIGNYTFSIGLRKVKEGVEQGRSVEACMAEIEYFPKMLTEMTGVGERSGSMEKTLDIIGDYYTNETDMATSRLLSLMEPVMTVGLAVMTVILLLAVYLPMFSMYGGVV